MYRKVHFIHIYFLFVSHLKSDKKKIQTTENFNLKTNILKLDLIFSF